MIAPGIPLAPIPGFVDLELVEPVGREPRLDFVAVPFLEPRVELAPLVPFG